MKIIFNIHALIQAVIILPIIFVITLFVPSDFLKDWIPYSDAEIMVLFLVASLVATVLDVSGIKGKIFYIPTWALLLAFAFFVFEVDNVTFKISSILFAIIRIVFHTLKTRKRLKKEWQHRKRLMNEFKNDSNKIDESEFWRYASELYFQPSLLFLYINPIWRVIYDNAIDRTEFIDYYKYFISSINLDYFNGYSNKQYYFYKKEIEKLQRDLNNSDSFVGIKHRPFSLYRLGLAIDFKNNTSSNSL